MTWTVLKFGGTTVAAGLPHLRRARRAWSGRVAIVVSACGDTTDLLDDASRSGHIPLRLRDRWREAPELDALVALLGTPPTPARHDAILALGELHAARTVASGLPDGFAVDARAWTVTDDTHGSAVVDLPRTTAALRDVVEHWQGTPVITGFLGATPEGVTTTLGRGGSDYTATIVGAALQAETIVIHTDVHGVLSADPRRVPNAVTLSQLSFSDAVRMAQAGAQVLHPHTLAPVRGTATTVWVAHGAASGPRTRMHELARTTQLSLVRTDDAIVAVGPGHATLPEALGCRSLGADLRPQQTRCPVNDDDALRHAHRALVETQRVADVFVLGAGTVGSALIDQLADRRHRLVGVGTRSKLAFDPEGVTSWRGLAAVGAWSREALLDRLARCPLPVLVDCTAADTTALYRAAFARDIHVVTANKGPIAGEPTLRDGPIWFGTTVGAAVPVLETLRGLQRGGRAVHTVEGCFSGTLAFVCDAVLGGLDFDDAVAEAQRQGLTEPDPAEDLSGRDVARKARIVADELGLEGPIALEPLTREAMATCVQQARVLGGAVRYLARLSDDLRIGLVAVPPDHPAMARRAGEAWCAFTTDDGPVVVRGPGAGPVVTASGLLDDLDRACLVAPTRERRRHA